MVEGRAFDAKLPGGPFGSSDYPANFFQSPHNQSTFGLPKRRRGRRSYFRMWGSRQRIWQHTILREYDGALNQILQFADIPRPLVVDQRQHGRFRYYFDALADLAAAQLDEVPHQPLNVFAAVPQRWQQKWKYI
jgi:hypothetical protein